MARPPCTLDKNLELGRQGLRLQRLQRKNLEEAGGGQPELSSAAGLAGASRVNTVMIRLFR